MRDRIQKQDVNIHFIRTNGDAHFVRSEGVKVANPISLECEAINPLTVQASARGVRLEQKCFDQEFSISRGTDTLRPAGLRKP